MERDLKLSTQRNHIWKSIDGFEAHHWSYNKKDARDVMYLSEKSHQYIHHSKILRYDDKSGYFISNEGELLNTKQKHIDFLEKHIVIDFYNLEDYKK